MKKKRKARTNRDRDEISPIYADLTKFVEQRRAVYAKRLAERKALSKAKRSNNPLREPRATLELLLAEIELRAAETLEHDVSRIVAVAAQRVEAIEHEARAAIAAEFATHRANRALQKPPQSKPAKGVKAEVHKLSTQAQYATALVLAEVTRLRVEAAAAPPEEAAVLREELRAQIDLADRLKRCLRQIAAKRS